MTENTCCAPQVQTACCEPSDKAACCGAAAADEPCGCAAGHHGEPPADIRDTGREPGRA